MNFPEWDNGYFATKTGMASAVLLQSYREGGKKKFFLITKTIPIEMPFECHACNPLLSAAVFAKSNGTWKIEAQNLFIMYEGEYGSSPKAELIQIGNDKFAAKLEYEHRFDMLLETEIALLIPYQDRIENAYQQVIYFDNFNGCGWGLQCAAYKAKIDFDKSTKKDDFYKIKVTRFGTENDKEQDNIAVPVEEKSVYQYTNGKYQQISWNGYSKINYKKHDNEDDD